MSYFQELKLLVEDDLAKHMGRRIYNNNLWICLLVDFLLIQLVVGPFTVCIWRGAWKSYDYIFNAIFLPLKFDPTYIGLICFSSGVITSIVIALSYREMDSIAKRAGTVRYFIVSRVYSMMRFLIALLYWKGIFDMLDHSYTKDWLVSHFSVALASSALFIIGAFKSAAITPPLGINLDKANDYINISTFYGSKRSDPIHFRFLDALCTIVVEVISTVAFYGAWKVGEHWFGGETNVASVTIKNALIALALAHGLSVVVFLSQFIYLYNHHKCDNNCYVREWKDLFYALILICSLFATASYFRGWFDLMDVLVQSVFPYNHVDLANIASFFIAFAIVILMGTASYNHFGVAREARREEEGILLPFFYLTYYFRDRNKEAHNGVGGSSYQSFITHDDKFARIAECLGLGDSRCSRTVTMTIEELRSQEEK